MRVLLVEDDRRIASNLASLLQTHRYVVDTAFTGEDGLFRAQTQDYDVIILDLMLPDVQGIEVCRDLRKKNIKSAILMLTAKSQMEDIVEGLESGADDYLPKPFAAEILLARMKALIRRKIAHSPGPLLHLKDLTVDTNKAQAFYKGKILDLAPKEFALLEYLLMHKCRVLNRMELLEHVWGETVDELSNTVDVHIRYLRKKIDDRFKTGFIKTVKNKGYMICDS